MTAPTLSETLQALAERVPKRVLRAGKHSCIVWLRGRSRPIDLDEWTDLLLLRAALEEECAARGWGVNLYLIPGDSPCAEVFAGGTSYLATAPDVAHALALPLLRALEAQETGERS